MIAYFVRRIVGGLATAWAATLIFYSLFILPNIPIEPQLCLDCSHRWEKVLNVGGTYLYHLDKPWPINYASWLFNFDGATSQTFTIPGELIISKRSDPITLQISRSSLLMGDFGRSLGINPGTSTLVLYGIEPTYLYSFILASLFSLMLIATLQRRGRPPVPRSTRVPARSRWRPAELWSLG